jgi:branched-chain amino acid transport system ATP-binding protein
MMLRLDSVESGYGASQVLFDVSLEIDSGEVVTLLGRNGMGKTTTVRADHGPQPGECRPHRVRGTRYRGIAALPSLRGWGSAWCRKAGRSSRI